jgi:hypothetical protein
MEDDQQPVSVRSEPGAMRSGRLWLVLAACATTTGGVLSAYSFVSPLLTDRAGIAAAWVPLVLVGFGVGSLIGTVVGGRLGDVHPHATTVAVAASTTVVLLAIGVPSAHPGPTVLLIVLLGLLGLLGLSANPVLSSLAVRFAGVQPRWQWRCRSRRTTSAPRSAPGSPAAPSTPSSGRPVPPWSARASPCRPSSPRWSSPCCSAAPRPEADHDHQRAGSVPRVAQQGATGVPTATHQAGDLRGHRSMRYFRRLRAITMRCTWLVPS